MRSVHPYSDDYYSIRAIPLDEFGNYLADYSSIDEDITWSLSKKCQSLENEVEIDEYFEQPFDDKTNLDIGIAFDNSAASSQSFEVINYIKDFIQYLSPEDNIFFSTFNQNYLQMFALSPPEKALWELENLELADPIGLNALYKAAYKTTAKLGDGFYDDRICILITYNSDNASIIYTANDIAKIAKESEIPVYIIGIGNAIESYSLKFICDASGGRFYHIMENELENLTKILTEIALSQKGFYEFSIPIEDTPDCDEISSTLFFENYDTEVKEKAKLILKPKLQAVKYQALANFDYKEVFIRAEFEDVLNSLAFVMTNNPDYTIQLAGHSSAEGTNKENFDLSLQRAKNVRGYLISQGVSEHKVKVRGEGYHKPLYYLQLSDWQQKYNRRVEIRWLDPKLKPYELSAEILESEEDVSNAVISWEEKGYKAYYDRYIVDNRPMYQVKIWGYSTLEQAEKAVKQINNKYKKKFAVD